VGGSWNKRTTSCWILFKKSLIKFFLGLLNLSFKNERFNLILILKIMGNKKNNFKKPGVKTLSIHHGKTFAEDTGCVMPPIFSTSTFIHGN